jgi:iron(III) transport system substrate-binding protein
MKTLAALAIFCCFLTGCGPSEKTSQNTLTIYSAGPRPLIEKICADFTEEFGIQTDLFVATTGQVMAKLAAEKYRPRADIVIFASAVAAEALKAEDRLYTYTPHALEETHRDWHDPDNTYFATSAALVGIAMRESSYDPKTEWADILSGNFPGRVTMPSPSRSGSAGDFVVAYSLQHGSNTWDQFLAARQAGLEFSAANSQAITALLIGAYDAIIGAVDYLIYRQIADGAPLKMHFPASGSALVTRPIAILKHTPKPDHAKAFLDYYFTTTVQQHVADQYLLPARKDTELNPLRIHDLNHAVIPLSTPEALKNQSRILRRFQLEIERAAVVRP